MRGVRNDRERFLALQLARTRLSFKRRDFFVAFADDEKRRRFHVRQRFAGQIRPSTARNDCADGRPKRRRCAQRRRATRARAEVADAQISRMRIVRDLLASRSPVAD